MMKTLLAYMKLQLLLLRVRLLPRFMLLAVVMAAAVPILLTSSRQGPPQGFRILANAADLVVTAVIILTTVMGAVSLSGDSSSGVLRAVLVRPITRSGLVTGQAISLVLFAAFLHLVGMGVAFLLARATLGFQPVEHEGYEIISRNDMLGYTQVLLILSLPAIVCAPLVALLVSSVVDDVALAVVVSLALVMGPYLFGTLTTDLPDWLFTEQASLPVRILKDLAQGIQVDLRALEQGDIAYRAVTIPMLYATVLLGGTLLLFNLRDCKA